MAITKTGSVSVIFAPSSHQTGGFPPDPITSRKRVNINYLRSYERTPDFFGKKKRKETLLPLPFYYVQTSDCILEGSSAVFDNLGNLVESTSGVCRGTYVVPGGVAVPRTINDDGLFTLLHDRSDASLLPKIKNQSINLAQAFAERGQTAELVASTAKRLAKVYTALRHGNLPAAINNLVTGASPTGRQLASWKQKRSLSPERRAGSTWLELQYGWKPLLSDVYGAAQLCAESLQRVRLERVSVKLKYDDHVIVPLSPQGLSNNLLMFEDWTWIVTMKQSCTFSLDSQAARSMSQIGVSNPLNLAWELLPYSFVIDWFLPIGNWLSNIDATAGLTFHSRVTSFKSEHKAIVTSSAGSNAGYQYATSMKGIGICFETGRYIHSDFPSNPLPSFKNPFSMTHCFNALALLQTAFGRK